MKQTSKLKTPVKLSPEESVALQEGIQSEATGKEYGLEECIEFARGRRKAWMKKPENLSA